MELIPKIKITPPTDMAYKTEDLLSQDRNGQTKPKPNPTRRRKHKPAPESHSDQMIDIMNKEREDAHKT